MSTMNTNFDIRFRRKVKRVSDLTDKTDSLIDQILSGAIGKIWSGECEYIADDTPDLNGDKHQNLVFRFTRSNNNIDKDRFDRESDSIIRNASDKMGKFSGPSWYQVDEENNQISRGLGRGDSAPKMYVGWEKLRELFDSRPDKLWEATDEEIANHPSFAHIYSCEHVIRMLCRQVYHAIQTEGKDTFHALLFGDPGAAKSSILEALTDYINYPVIQENSENSAVFRIDLEGSTASGSIAKLMELANGMQGCPPIVIFEEVEKVNNEDFWKAMLPALDFRQTLSKLTYRKEARAYTPMLALATANNMVKFENFLSGAIASRFAKKIQVARPNATTMRKILEHRIQDIQGDPQWVDAIMKIGARLKLLDPREYINMIAGRESLIPKKGESQSDYEKDMLKCYESVLAATKSFEQLQEDARRDKDLLNVLYPTK